MKQLLGGSERVCAPGKRCAGPRSMSEVHDAALASARAAAAIASAERDKLWQVVEALLAPAPAEPRSLSPMAGASPAPTFGLGLGTLSLAGGGSPSPPASPRSSAVHVVVPSSPSTAKAATAEGHVLDLLYSLLAGDDGLVACSDLQRLGKTVPPSPLRGGGGGGERVNFEEFQRLLGGAGRRSKGESKFAFGRRKAEATAAAATEENVTPRATGEWHTSSWRVDFFYEGVPMSPWHDIPVYVGTPASRVVHMVVEIVR